MSNRKTEAEGQFEEARAQKQIIVDGEPFIFLKQRDYSSIQVFKGERGFLRVAREIR
jgi:hypothetical protein